MTMAQELARLVTVLNGLAAATWHKVEVGPGRGLRFGEESLTDHNMFELDRLSTATDVYKFDHREEEDNGADFDLYIGAGAAGWIGLRFQAKKLEDWTYKQLGHDVGAAKQYDLLLRQAALDGVAPFYCFYNGWGGSWPSSISNAACPVGVLPTRGVTGGCEHARLEDFGCAVVPAGFVAARHKSTPRRGRLRFEDYLAQSVPWSHLFQAPLRAGATSVTQVIDVLRSSLAAGRDGMTLGEAFVPSADNSEMAELGRNRLELLSSLPDWLIEAQEGAYRTRGYRPRRAVVVDLARLEDSG